MRLFKDKVLLISGGTGRFGNAVLNQMTFFEVAMEGYIDMNHELVQLSKAIDWSEVESEFSYYCSDNGRPGVPIRKMVGLMLLKNIYDLSDEAVVARWMENPYMQYFTWETVFQKRPPINPADFSKFRKRIGKEGAEKLFRLSLMVNAKEMTRKEMKQVIVDSTVQEKNITFPTDAKLYRKVISHLKSDHRMIRNCLRGTLGDSINTLLAAAVYNLRHWMNELPHSSFVSCLLAIVRQLENKLFENQQYPRLRPFFTDIAK